MADEEFQQTGDNAEKTYPIRAGEVKKGMTVLLKGFPCKVVEVTTSKTGKHGHAKANITGLDIFTGKKYQDVSPTSHNMTAPFVSITSWSCLDVIDGYCSLMDEDGNVREDLACPGEQSGGDAELGIKITNAMNEGKEVTLQVTKAMETEQITDCKVA